MRIGSETEMLRVGEKLGEEILRDFANPKHLRVIELIGDVGVGKTTFTRGLALGLGIKEPVTSPSFTLSKVYAFSTDSGTGELVHYDFYRLDDPGLLAEDLAEALMNSRSLVVTEWGESVRGLLPEERLTVKITLDDEDAREIEFLGNHELVSKVEASLKASRPTRADTREKKGL